MKHVRIINCLLSNVVNNDVLNNTPGLWFIVLEPYQDFTGPCRVGQTLSHPQLEDVGQISIPKACKNVLTTFSASKQLGRFPHNFEVLNPKIPKGLQLFVVHHIPIVTWSHQGWCFMKQLEGWDPSVSAQIPKIPKRCPDRQLAHHCL